MSAKHTSLNSKGHIMIDMLCDPSLAKYTSVNSKGHIRDGMTQETKHTPAPWDFFGEIKPVGDSNTATGCHNFYIGRVIQKDIDGYRGDICTIQSCDHIQGISREEAKANIKLIAAAPETAAERDRLKESNGALLEALKGILTEYSLYHGSTKRICAAHDKACAAIKNAEANHG